MDLTSLRDLPTDSLIQIALDLNLDDVQHICSADNMLNQKLCQNELFWELLFRRDFPNLTWKILPIKNRSPTYWKDLYQERNRWDGIFRMENYRGIKDKQPKLLLSARYITDLVIFGKNTLAFVSNGKLYFYKSDQPQLIDDYGSDIKKLVKIYSDSLLVLTYSGKVYITNPKSIKEERTQDVTPENTKIKHIQSNGYDNNFFMDYENNFYVIDKFSHLPRFVGTLKHEGEIIDFLKDSTFDIIKYILEANGNFYKYSYDDKKLLDTNVRKITDDFVIKKSGDVWVDREIRITDPGEYRYRTKYSYESLLIDKNVKDISRNYYVDEFNDIYRYDEDGVYPIPKSSLMGNVHQIEISPTFPGEILFVLAEVKPHQEVTYEEIVELIQSPNFQQYEIGKLEGINHEIVVTMNDNSIYTSWVFISQGKIYPPTYFISYDEIEDILNSPNLKNYFFIDTDIEPDIELYMELITGERYLSIVGISHGEIKPPFIDWTELMPGIARRKAGYST